MFSRTLHHLVDSRAFQRTILAVIILAAIVVGIETDQSIMARWGVWLHALDRAIVAIFVVEALLKIGAHGRTPWRYFRDPWNCFDFTIVVLCLIPAIGPYAAIARLARVLRTLRLITGVPKLQLIVNSLLKGLPSMGFVGLLLLMLFYVYGVLGVFLFRANDPVHFGDLPTALLTMFRIVTLEGWTDILDIQMHGSANFAGFVEINHTGIEPISRAQPMVATLFFVSFVLLGTIVSLNLVIGVIVSSMDEAEHEREQRFLRHRRESGEALTMGEEIRLLEHELGLLSKHLSTIRRRIGDEEPTLRPPAAP